jgi:transcriptional regulatory protein AMDR
MHRDLDVANVDCQMPIQDRRIYRRVWWTLVQAEAFSALDHGRPSMIRHEDFDQPFLSDPDFVEDETVSRKTQKDFCHVNVQLALLALEVLQSHAPRARREDSTVNKKALGARLATIGFSIPAAHNFWSCQLRINYNMILLVLYRKTPGMVRVQQDAEDGALMCSEAASDVLTTFEAMGAQHTVRQCQSSSVSALMAATIQFSQDCRSAIERGSYVRALGIHNQIQRLLGPAKQLSEHWPNAAPVARLCQRYCEEFGSLLKHGIRASSTMPIEQPHQDFETNWQDIFADFDAHGFDQYLQPSEWMNASVPLQQ